MDRYISTRIRNNQYLYFGMQHEFINSHQRKLHDLPNSHITPSGNFDFYRNTGDAAYNAKMLEYIRPLLDEMDAVCWRAQRDYKEHHPRAMKNTTNLFYQGVITFGNKQACLSREEMNQLDQAQLDQAALAFMDAFCAENGISSQATCLVKHNDESQIHYHYCFIGYDFENHMVFRNRLTPTFCSALQDKIGAHFAHLGFSRGVKKQDRIADTMRAQGLAPEAYQHMTIAEKAKIKNDANVSHKTVRTLHSELKNELFRLDNAIQQGLGLFDLVANSLPEELEKIKEQMGAARHLKIVNRFFTYALRFHNEKADKTKAIKNLENTIDRLGQDKAEIEREFMLYHEKRQRQLQAQYGVSADQDFANLTADNALLLIKKEGLQREIAAMEREKQQRLGQDAAATDQGPSAADSSVGKVKTLTVNRGLGSSMRM